MAPWTFYNSNGEALIQNAESAATQTVMEAATSTTAFVSPARTQYHPGVAKAWIRFNGSGTINNDASYGVDTIVDDGTGTYTVEWAVDFSSENYGLATAGPGDDHIFVGHTASPIAGEMEVRSRAVGAEGNSDANPIWVVAYGDQ